MAEYSHILDSRQIQYIHTYLHPHFQGLLFKERFFVCANGSNAFLLPFIGFENQGESGRGDKNFNKSMEYSLAGEGF